MSVLPAGWIWSTIATLARSMKNGVYKPRDSYNETGIACLRMYNIERGSIVWKDIKRMRLSNAELEEYGLLPGDVLVNRVNSRELVGKAAVIPLNIEPCVFESKNIRLRVRKEAVAPAYLNYYLLLSGSRYFATNAQQTVGMASINQDQLGAIALPLPPLAEQHRIVAEIEKQFTRLDAAEAALRSAKIGLRRYRAAVLQAACEGRLAPPAPAGSQFGIHEKCASWRWTTVAELGSTSDQAVLTGPFGSTVGRKDFLSEGVPMLTIGCLTEGGVTTDKAMYVSAVKAEQLKRYRLRAGDLLFSRMATVGRAGIVPENLTGALINYHLMRLRLDDHVIDPAYLLIYVRGSNAVAKYLRKVNHGATRDGINTSELLSMPIHLPPVVEQQKIIQEVDRQLSVIRETEDLLDANLRRAARLRQSILKRAFEGRLVPQNPADEPATVLLERIRAERAAHMPTKVRAVRRRPRPTLLFDFAEQTA